MSPALLAAPLARPAHATSPAHPVPSAPPARAHRPRRGIARTALALAAAAGCGAGALAVATPAGAAPAARLSVGDAAVVEGDAGVRPAFFTVSLDRPVAVPVVVDYRTVDAGAMAPADYTTTTGTLTIPAGAVSAIVRVPVRPDVLPEGNEAYKVEIATPTAGIALFRPSGIGTILDDDNGPAPVAPRISVGDVGVVEGDVNVRPGRFTVSSDRPLPCNVTLWYASMDVTAVAPVDYVAIPLSSVTMPAGSVWTTITARVRPDQVPEPAEQFNVVIMDWAAACPVQITKRTGVGTIIDDV